MIRDRANRLRQSAAGAAAGIALVALSGCGIQIPADPSGTLDTVRGGELRVGVSPHEGLIEVGTGADDVSGPEIEAIQAFADSVDANPVWTVGSEEALVRDLEQGDLDLVAGGLTDATPWVDQAGVTRPYTEVTDDDGSVLKIVMLVPLGENAFLTELETFLDGWADGARG
jgi:ABC-type amino acid transport substrate-binding protein